MRITHFSTSVIDLPRPTIIGILYVVIRVQSGKRDREEKKRKENSSLSNKKRGKKKKQTKT